MKKVINVILGICVLAMLFICYRSITDQQKFDADVAQNEKDVKARLMQIRDAEEAYKAQMGWYCGDWDSLITFIETGKLPTIRREGTLSDEQMDKGLTEAKVGAILKRGDASEIASNGLTGFVRDTSWVVLKDSLFGPDFDAKQICYIPHSDENGDKPEKFFLLAVWDKTKSDEWISVMECTANYDSYLKGPDKKNQWKREVDNRIKETEDSVGLKIGVASAKIWNNNAGNWE